MNLILVVLILHYLRTIFLPKSAILCCGLFGWSGKGEMTDSIKQKIKALGLFNQNRGKDSCGYFNGEDIYKGTYLEKEFFNFIVKNGLKASTNGNNIFIGHTRASTVGVANEANAHPFNIKDQMVIAHNGTITNIWTLLKEHGIDKEKEDINVDSLALGHMLLKDGPKVLEEYDGYAALLVHMKSEPNTMYMYHGKCKNYMSGPEQEERPLFFMKTADGIFMSSLIDALKWIREIETDEEPEEVPHNLIIKVVNGEIAKEIPYKITRGEANCWKPAASTNTWDYRQQGQPTVRPNSLRTVPSSNASNLKKIREEYENKGVDVDKETYPDNGFKSDDFIYFHGGRYKKGMHVVDGIFIVNRKTGEIVNNKKDADRCSEMCFYKGVYLENKKAYDDIQKILDLGSGDDYRGLTDEFFNFAKTISRWSKYPVRCLPDESTKLSSASNGRYKWWLGETYVGTKDYSPLLSNRIYSFSLGTLNKIKGEKNEQVLLGEQPEFEEWTEDVEKIETQFRRVYKDKGLLAEEITDFGIRALEMYIEDVLLDMHRESYEAATVELLLQDLLDDAIAKEVPVYDLMEPAYRNIKKYLTDALAEYQSSSTEGDDAPLVEADTELGSNFMEPVQDTVPYAEYEEIVENGGFKALEQSELFQGGKKKEIDFRPFGGNSAANKMLGASNDDDDDDGDYTETIDKAVAQSLAQAEAYKNYKYDKQKNKPELAPVIILKPKEIDDVEYNNNLVEMEEDEKAAEMADRLEHDIAMLQERAEEFKLLESSELARALSMEVENSITNLTNQLSAIYSNKKQPVAAATIKKLQAL